MLVVSKVELSHMTVHYQIVHRNKIEEIQRFSTTFFDLHANSNVLWCVMLFPFINMSLGAIFLVGNPNVCSLHDPGLQYASVTAYFDIPMVHLQGLWISDGVVYPIKVLQWMCQIVIMRVGIDSLSDCIGFLIWRCSAEQADVGWANCRQWWLRTSQSYHQDQANILTFYGSLSLRALDHQQGTVICTPSG